VRPPLYGWEHAAHLMALLIVVPAIYRVVRASPPTGVTRDVVADLRATAAAHAVRLRGHAQVRATRGSGCERVDPQPGLVAPVARTQSVWTPPTRTRAGRRFVSGHNWIWRRGATGCTPVSTTGGSGFEPYRPCVPMAPARRRPRWFRTPQWMACTFWPRRR
jgi:hypothetical protein